MRDGKRLDSAASDCGFNCFEFPSVTPQGREVRRICMRRKSKQGLPSVTRRVVRPFLLLNIAVGTCKGKTALSSSMARPLLLLLLQGELGKDNCLDFQKNARPAESTCRPTAAPLNTCKGKNSRKRAGGWQEHSPDENKETGEIISRLVL